MKLPSCMGYNFEAIDKQRGDIEKNQYYKMTIYTQTTMTRMRTTNSIKKIRTGIERT